MMNQAKVKTRLYLLATILGLIFIVGIYEFIQYRKAKQQEEQGVQQIVEQMQKQGLKVSMGENGVITVRP